MPNFVDAVKELFRVSFVFTEIARDSLVNIGVSFQLTCMDEASPAERSAIAELALPIEKKMTKYTE